MNTGERLNKNKTMYFPKSQIKSNQYTKGGEFQNSSTQEEYIGFYFETSTGEYYAGKNPTDFPVFPLVEISNPTLINDLNFLNELTPPTTKYFEWTYEYLTSPLPQEVNILQPNRIYPTPSTADYTLGEFQRYFLSKTNEPKFIEVDKTQYTQYLNQDPNVAYQLYQPFNLPWVISGDRNEVYNVNKKTVERIQFQLKLRGFKSYFKERYDQFYK